MPRGCCLGLGIRHTGAVTARDLLRRYGTLPAVRALAEDIIVLRDATEPALGESETRLRNRLDKAIAERIGVENVGAAVGHALADFFLEPHNVAAWDDLLAEVAPPPFVVETKVSEVSGQTVVFTGKLETMSRDEAKASRAARREDRGIGLQGDRSGGCRRRRRIEAQESDRPRHPRDRRGGLGGDRRQRKLMPPVTTCFPGDFGPDAGPEAAPRR